MAEIFYNKCQIENVGVDIEPDGVYLAIEAPHETVDGKYQITKIKDKTVKMTVEEIEKKLGHKIEIISK